MARYNVKNLFAQDNKWNATLENGMRIRGIGKNLEVYSKTSKKFKKTTLEGMRVLSCNRVVAIMQIEKVFGKLATVHSLEGKQLKLSSLEKGKRGPKGYAYYNA